MIVPQQLIENCRKVPARQVWLDNLPALLDELRDRWCLRTGPPFDHVNVTCSWVAPVVRADGTPAVVKLGMPHMEGADEIRGLRFWNGDPTVQLEADDGVAERCQPCDYFVSSRRRRILSLQLYRALAKTGQDLPRFQHLSSAGKLEPRNPGAGSTLARAGLVRHGTTIKRAFQTIA